MSLALSSHIMLLRPDIGGLVLKEWRVSSTFIAALANLGLIRVQIAGIEPTDTTKLWFDTTDTTQGPDGSLKTHDGTSYVLASVTGLIDTSANRGLKLLKQKLRILHLIF